MDTFSNQAELIKNDSGELTAVKAPRGAVKKAHWYYMFFRHGHGFTYNHGANLACAMGIILSRIYKSKEKLAEELKKYYFYFDTNVPFAGAVVGLLTGMEESRAAQPKKVTADSITSMAIGMMGSVGSIGDIFQQGIINPIILTLSISLCGDQYDPSIIGPIFAMVATSLVTIAISYGCWMKVYDLGEVIVSRVLQGGLMDKVVKASYILGCTAMGALIAKYVTVTSALGWQTETTTFVVQTQLLDAILPKLLPLSITLILLAVLKKGISPQKLVWISMGAALVLALLGILGPVPQFA